MKKNAIYTFYTDDDIVPMLKKSLNIIDELPSNPTTCRMEPIDDNSFANQIKEANWSEVGNGRHTILYYLDYYVVYDDDGDEDTPLQSLNFRQVHIIVRHNTKEEVQAQTTESMDKIINIMEDDIDKQ